MAKWKVNINIYVQNLLVEHLGFTHKDLLDNEVLLKQGFDIMKDDFLKLIIDVKTMMDKKKINIPSAYFIGALKNELILKGVFKKKGYV
jgi:hypothetical protein